MLDISIKGDILTVVEISHYFLETRKLYWYYDIKNWRSSSNGKEGDPIDRDMSEHAIKWVQKHFLPKAVRLAEGS